jgi:hypothetical protein
VFVNSMSDLFHEQIPDEYIARSSRHGHGATRHTFQVLTKRPERMRDVLSDSLFKMEVAARCAQLGREDRDEPVLAAPERLARRLDREPPLRRPRRPPARDAGGGAVHQRGAAARPAGAEDRRDGGGTRRLVARWLVTRRASRTTGSTSTRSTG